MATTQKRTSSGARSGASRSSGSRSGGSRTAAKGRAPSRGGKRPVRREVWGIVLLLAGLCVLVSYFTGDGWLINLIPRALKGLTGVGYYLTLPALWAAAWVLLTHRGRPVALRTACALLTPYLFGGVCHLLFCKLDLSDPAGLFPTLWESGFALESGGALSGATAHGFVAVLGKPASVIIFIVLLLVLVMVVFQVTPSLLLQMWRERERPDYSEEDYEDEEEYFEPVPKKQPPKPKKQTARARAVIDIPLDDPAPHPVEQPPEERPTFFRPREKDQLTPADVAAPPPEPVPPPVESVTIRENLQEDARESVQESAPVWE